MLANTRVQMLRPSLHQRFPPRPIPVLRAVPRPTTPQTIARTLTAGTAKKNAPRNVELRRCMNRNVEFRRCMNIRAKNIAATDDPNETDDAVFRGPAPRPTSFAAGRSSTPAIPQVSHHVAENAHRPAYWATLKAAVDEYMGTLPVSGGARPTRNSSRRRIHLDCHEKTNPMRSAPGRCAELDGDALRGR